MRRFILLLAWLVAWPGHSGAAPGSGDFPSRPIRIVAPFSAGSGADQASRFFGDQLACVLGQPVVVENRTGAGGILAVNTVRTAPADADAIVQVLADGLQKVLSTQVAKDYAGKELVERLPLGPEAMRTFQRDEIARFGQAAAAAGIQPR